MLTDSTAAVSETLPHYTGGIRMKSQDHPREIERAALDLAATVDEMTEIRERLKDVEMETLDGVINAKGSDEKPLCTNDRARELAVHRILKSDHSYQRDRSTLRILEHKRASIEAELDRLRREFRLAIIDYEREQLGKREAA
jgi:hypothetical protein